MQEVVVFADVDTCPLVLLVRAEVALVMILRMFSSLLLARRRFWLLGEEEGPCWGFVGSPSHEWLRGWSFL